ncbi:MAG: glutamine--tRNA ligase, partial [Desulfitobacterium hafniense]
IKCEEVIKDDEGKIIEIRCTYDPETKSGTGFTGRKVKGTIHWVEATQAVPAEFRLYEPLIQDDYINPNSLEIRQGFVEPYMKEAKPQDKFQFPRHGYFNVDPNYTTPESLVLNLIVSLKSSFVI